MKFRALRFLFIFAFLDLLTDPIIMLLRYGEIQDYFYPFNNFQHFLIFLSSNLTNFSYALIVYAFFYYLFPKQKWKYLVFGIFLSFLIPFALRFFLEQILYDFLFGFSNYPDDPTFSAFSRDNYFYAIRYVAYGIAYYLIHFALFKEEQKNELKEANQKMEMSLLRSQINPHFLLNSLNNIYSLVYQKSDQSLEAIDKLSEVLKYSLYEKKEMVLLEDEMKQVYKIIDLYKMRFDYPIIIKTEVNLDKEKCKIPPFIIIPLIENAFKHGDLKDRNQPVEIKIQTNNNWIKVDVKNKKANQAKDSVGGIGLDNIRRRLNIIYPDQHEFQINETELNFSVHIKIPTS